MVLAHMVPHASFLSCYTQTCMCVCETSKQINVYECMLLC